MLAGSSDGLIPVAAENNRSGRSVFTVLAGLVPANHPSEPLDVRKRSNVRGVAGTSPAKTGLFEPSNASAVNIKGGWPNPPRYASAGARVEWKNSIRHRLSTRTSIADSSQVTGVIVSASPTAPRLT